MIGCCNNCIYTYVNGENRDDGCIWLDIDIYRLKPLLRPLSDLTKEIEHKGEKFAPYDKLKAVVSEEQWIKICYSVGGDYTKICDMPYWWVRLLHSWHFDTEGLIEQGLAITK